MSMQYCLVQGTEGSKYTNLYFIFCHLSICYIQEQIYWSYNFICFIRLSVLSVLPYYWLRFFFSIGYEI